ncbi:MAG: hypothetical protein JWM48_2143 [Mycobacterium sp.]|nr:hypothetical protein [Mycobacterium sp.]
MTAAPPRLWLDLASGAAGDMLLGALHGAGVPLDVLAAPVRALGLGLDLRAAPTHRGGLAALAVTVTGIRTDAAAGPRGLSEVLGALPAAGPDPAVLAAARRVFTVLAEAEAAVHGVGVDEVHFHEVGAHDALADVLGVCAGLVHLVGAPGGGHVTATPPALGGGCVPTAHGRLPVPGPAVLELLRAARMPSRGGPVDVELLTPTGAALLTVWVDAWGPLPAGTVTGTGTGAGTRDLPGHPNVVRAVLLDPAPDGTAGTEVLLEANVDDLDPRLWPDVVDGLLAAGAVDAWLTPIVMKRGRPAVALAALAPTTHAAAVRAAVFALTSTIGLRETTPVKRALARREVTLPLHGQPVRFKVSGPDGATVTPEYRDVAAAATAAGVPVRLMLQDAQALAARLRTGELPDA